MYMEYPDSESGSLCSLSTLSTVSSDEDGEASNIYTYKKKTLLTPDFPDSPINLLSPLMSHKKEVKIVVEGYKNAGKTAFLYNLSEEDFSTEVVSSSFFIEQYSVRNIKIQVFHTEVFEPVSGLYGIKKNPNLYENTSAICLIIDSTMRENIKESKRLFNYLLKIPALKNAVYAILANKHDVPGARKIADIMKYLRVNSLHIKQIKGFEISAVNGEGLNDVMKWLCEALKKKLRK